MLDPTGKVNPVLEIQLPHDLQFGAGTPSLFPGKYQLMRHAIFDQRECAKESRHVLAGLDLSAPKDESIGQFVIRTHREQLSRVSDRLKKCGIEPVMDRKYLARIDAG